jgi:hypothetical protein
MGRLHDIALFSGGPREVLPLGRHGGPGGSLVLLTLQEELEVAGKRGRRNAGVAGHGVLFLELGPFGPCGDDRVAGTL